MTELQRLKAELYEIQQKVERLEAQARKVRNRIKDIQLFYD